MIALTIHVGKMEELSFYGSGNITISDIQIVVTVAHCKSFMRFRGAKIELQKKEKNGHRKVLSD